MPGMTRRTSASTLEWRRVGQVQVFREARVGDAADVDFQAGQQMWVFLQGTGQAEVGQCQKGASLTRTSVLT